MPLEHLAQQARRVVARRQAEGGVPAVGVPAGAELAAASRDLSRKVGEAVAGVVPRHRHHGLGLRPGGHRVHDLLDHQAPGAIVDLLEVGGDAGLQRKAAQEARAEGVDRLDLQP
ncbi:MAG: hypothetical protein MUE98_11185, partial [Rhodobacteraceae bacterium]|nr:hypothetical protein [Paracoccaceae bacterium]